MNNGEKLLENINMSLSNQYRVIDGENNVLYVQDKESGKYFKIIVKEIAE